MKNMDKGLTVPKWMLLFSLAENTPKIIFPIFCLPNPKNSEF